MSHLSSSDFYLRRTLAWPIAAFQAFPVNRHVISGGAFHLLAVGGPHLLSLDIQPHLVFTRSIARSCATAVGATMQKHSLITVIRVLRWLHPIIMGHHWISLRSNWAHRTIVLRVAQLSKLHELHGLVVGARKLVSHAGWLRRDPFGWSLDPSLSSEDRVLRIVDGMWPTSHGWDGIPRTARVS